MAGGESAVPSRRSVNEYQLEDEADSSTDSEFHTLEISDEALAPRPPSSKHVHPTNGWVRTFFHMMNGNIGTGILALPDAFKNAGIMFGSAGVVGIGLLTTYCCHLVLRACRRVAVDQPLSYAEVTEAVFRRAGGHHPGLPSKARLARQFVNGLLVISQIGFCAVYIKFCAHQLQDFLEDYYLATPRSLRFYETVISLLLLPYCFVTTLRGLAVFSMVAHVFSMVCLTIVMQHVLTSLKPMDSLPWFPPNLTKASLFFGTAMFTYESIALILPIENSMKDRSRFHGWNGLFSISMSVIILLYFIVGFFGYLAYGQQAQMILSNLPRKSALYNSVKLFYGISVFISYNLQLYVPVQIILPVLRNSESAVWSGRNGELRLRLALVVFTFACSIYIPCLEFMISLFGAFSSSWLAIVMPPIIGYLSLPPPSCHETQDGAMALLKNRDFIRCASICLFGISGCIMGTYVSMKSIINALTHPQLCAN